MTSTARTFLHQLRSLDVRVWAEGGQLKCSAPAGTLTAALREEIGRRKQELLAHLEEAAREEVLASGLSQGRPVPLSPAQRRFWFFEQLERGTAVLHIATSFRIIGPLNPRTLELALTEIASRHECLRMRVLVVGDEPVQDVLTPTPVQLPVTDLRALADDGRSRALESLQSDFFRHPFDLTQGPLWRAHLVQTTEHEHLLLFVMHHIIGDGWSVGILLSELTELYPAIRKGAPSPLPPLALQYRDFAVWQERRLRSDATASQLAWWRRHLSGPLPLLELPTDNPRPAVQRYRGGDHHGTLPAELKDALGALGRREGATLFMVLLAAFKVLLARWSGQSDVIVGAAIAGRVRPELERLVGVFINTLPLRSDISVDDGFLDILRRERDTCVQALEHQEIPFEQLVQHLDVPRDLGRTPVFQVLFNMFETAEVGRLEMGDTSIEIGPGPQPESKFDLTFYATARRDVIDCSLVYNADLFSAPRIADLWEQFVQLLTAVAQDPRQAVGSISLVTDAARHVLPDPLASLAGTWDGSVIERLRAHARNQPDAVAVRDAHKAWSYLALDRMTDGLAHTLMAHRVGRSDVVAVIGSRSAELAAALLGTWKAGAAFAILDPAHPAARLDRCLELLQPAGVISLDGGAASLGLAPAKTSDRLVLELEPALLARFLEDPPLPVPDRPPGPDDLAYVTFTSGSTGAPKGICGTHRPLSHFLEWQARRFGLGNRDVFSLFSGLGHDPLLRDTLAPVWNGGRLEIPDPDHMLAPHALLPWLDEAGVTVSHITPPLADLLARTAAEEDVGPLAKLRYVFFGGDRLHADLVSRISELAPNAGLVNCYGATETPQVAACHVAEPTTADRATSTVALGRGIDGVQLLVLNRHNRLAGAGELGEICVRTAYLAQGYLSDPAETRERFVRNPLSGAEDDRVYRTGDLGRYAPDGLVHYDGRGDAQIKVRGHRVEPAEIEAALAAAPGVAGAAVRFVTAAARVADTPATDRENLDGHGPRDGTLVAYIVPAPGQRLNSGDLRTHLRSRLPEYMVPSMFVPVASIPLTPNGKIDRQALPVPESPTAGEHVEHVPPRNRVERVIAQVWCDVLGLEKVSVFDNFFELGGHSFLATRLITRLRSTLQLDIQLRSLFLDSTIAGLARHIRYSPTTRRYEFLSEIPHWDCLVPMQPRGSRTPLFLVAGAHADEEAFLRYLSHMIPHLGLDQPVYGFKPRGLDGQEEPHASVTEMARDYVAALQLLQPHGPYLLAGECVGGVVAYEMAQLLAERGESVALLALLDTERPTLLRSRLSGVRLYRRKVVRHTNQLIEMMRSDPIGWPRVAFSLVRRKRQRLQSADADDVLVRRIRRTEQRYPRLVYKHRVRPYPGRLTLVVNERTHGFDPHLGWKGAAVNGLDIRVVPGNHITRLTLHGKAVADTLLACIGEASHGSAEARVPASDSERSRTRIPRHTEA